MMDSLQSFLLSMILWTSSERFLREDEILSHLPFFLSSFLSRDVYSKKNFFLEYTYYLLLSHITEILSFVYNS